VVVHLLRNPHAGHGDKQESFLQERIVAATEGHEVVDLTGGSADASGAALGSAIANGEVERLVVAGGDGLVHLAIQHLAQSAIPMQLVPGGTGNDFASWRQLSNCRGSLERRSPTK